MGEKLDQIEAAMAKVAEKYDQPTYMLGEYTRAAVDALREPTEAMCDIGNSILDYPKTATHSASVWRLMIDEILK